MYILVFFTDSGTPKTGLSPLISIWDVDNSTLLIDDAAMSEIDGGFYKYNYTAYKSRIGYVIRYDANDGTIDDHERYKYTGNAPFHSSSPQHIGRISRAKSEAFFREVWGLTVGT